MAKRILVVEDEQRVRAVIQKRLERAGYAVLAAADAQGVREGRAFNMQASASLPAQNLEHPQLPRTWAQLRVNALLEKIAREGEDRASVDEIIRLARTLSVEPASFMEKDLPESQPGQRRKAHEVRTQDYAYKTLTPFETGRHLMAFRVSIDPESTHKKVVYRHEGEEFIYVISGRLRLQVGKKHPQLGPGETIHFNSSERHILKNPGKEPAQLLVVVYAP